MSTQERYKIIHTYEGFMHSGVYEGHGHDFEENLVACCHYALPASPMTYGELADAVMAEVNASWFTLEPGEKSLRGLITGMDEVLMRAIKQEVGREPGARRPAGVPNMLEAR